MRVKELADLTGTTVRTIRYYHQIGLLPVPAMRDGRRAYDLTHVARVSRIRWLARAGVPLSRITGLLQDRPGAGTMADLTATAAAIEEQMAQLEAQRELVCRLLEAAVRGDLLSPMPAVAARFYEGLLERAPDEKVRREIRRERDFVELAYYRGDMPAEAEAVYHGFTEARLQESLASYWEIAHRSPEDHEVDQVALATVERMVGRLGPRFSRLAAALDPATVRRAAELYVRVSGDDERLSRAIADTLIRTIEEVRGR
ncbi:MerR family transcriptional regulator [Actinoplanes sp. NPDC049599]|uniref:MerR family transcriptional regulator n=1 Tax=Actinoplanes sp. NPDC049599 TaxID=3363903 RepID=UPI0037992756